MMTNHKRPDFSKIDYRSAMNSAASNEATKINVEHDFKSQTTPERIAIKTFFTAGDLDGITHLGYAAGLPPFLRGPYSTMYVVRPWTIRQ